MAEAIRDGLRPEAIAADIAGDGDAALPEVERRGAGQQVADGLIEPARWCASWQR